MSTLSTHVLDIAAGRPAEGIAVALEQKDGEAWRALASGVTNADGRIKDFLPQGHALDPAIYRITFQTGPYYAAKGQRCFYPYATIAFEIFARGEHYHVPLLLSPYGLSTYRGS